jgi:hypothetical protein
MFGYEKSYVPKRAPTVLDNKRVFGYKWQLLEYMEEAEQLLLIHEWGGPRCVKLEKKVIALFGQG